MNTKQVIGAVLGTVLKVALAVVVIFYIYKGATMAYDYGFRIFTEPAMTAEDEGWDVTVEITMGKSTQEIGEILKSKGLVRDARLFYLQNLLSEYRDQLRPGVYTFNTSMTAREMMEIMAMEPEPESTEEGAEEGTETE